MTQATLLELAERLEAATGPDRELDQQIELTLPGVLPHPDTLRSGYVTDEWAYVISGPRHPVEQPGQGYSSGRYTASIDAAMTLVPEGCGTLTTNISWEKWAQILHESRLDDGTGIAGPPLGSAKAVTLPLALCAAALRARAAQGGEQ